MSEPCPTCTQFRAALEDARQQVERIVEGYKKARLELEVKFSELQEAVVRLTEERDHYRLQLEQRSMPNGRNGHGH